MCEFVCDKHLISECSVCFYEKLGCVYYLRNTVNGKGYVGKHHTPDEQVRFTAHIKVAAGHGNQKPLYRAIRKYGVESFTAEVVWRGSTRLLDEKEAYYIEKLGTFIDDGAGYNLTRGGDGGVELSEAVRKKKSASHKAQWKNVEYRTKMCAIRSAICADPIYRAGMSRLRKLDWKKPEYLAKMKKRRGPVGCVRTPEQRAATSKSMKLFWRSNRKTILARISAGVAGMSEESRAAHRKATSKGVQAWWDRRRGVTKELSHGRKDL